MGLCGQLTALPFLQEDTRPLWVRSIFPELWRDDAISTQRSETLRAGQAWCTWKPPALHRVLTEARAGFQGKRYRAGQQHSQEQAGQRLPCPMPAGGGRHCPPRTSSPLEVDLHSAARAWVPKSTEEDGHEDSEVLLPSPRHGSPRRQTCFPCSQGRTLLYRASALLSNDAGQELGLRPRRLHVLPILFSNLCGKGRRGCGVRAWSLPGGLLGS